MLYFGKRGELGPVNGTFLLELSADLLCKPLQCFEFILRYVDVDITGAFEDATVDHVQESRQERAQGICGSLMISVRFPEPFLRSSYRGPVVGRSRSIRRRLPYTESSWRHRGAYRQASPTGS